MKEVKKNHVHWKAFEGEESNEIWNNVILEDKDTFRCQSLDSDSKDDSSTFEQPQVRQKEY